MSLDPAPITPGQRQVLAALGQSRAEAILIGGLGLQLHGFSEPTADVDLIVSTDPADRAAIEEFLAAVQARPAAAGGDLGVAFNTPHGRVELLHDTTGVGPYEQWVANATTQTVDGHPIHVADVNDIVRSKEASARSKDLDRLPLIRAQMLANGRLTAEQIRGEVEQSRQLTPAEQLFGREPQDPRKAATWRSLATMISRFRDKHGLTEHPEPLGPSQLPEPAAQERQDLQRQLDLVARTTGLQDAPVVSEQQPSEPPAAPQHRPLDLDDGPATAAGYDPSVGRLGPGFDDHHLGPGFDAGPIGPEQGPGHLGPPDLGPSVDR